MNQRGLIGLMVGLMLLVLLLSSGQASRAPWRSTAVTGALDSSWLGAAFQQPNRLAARELQPVQGRLSPPALSQRRGGSVPPIPTGLADPPADPCTDGFLIESTFAADNEGWQMYTSDTTHPGLMAAPFLVNGGNPDNGIGFTWKAICEDGSESCAVVLRAPAKFLGDQTQAYGKYFTFEYRTRDYIPTAHTRVNYQVSFGKVGSPQAELVTSVRNTTFDGNWFQVKILLNETESWTTARTANEVKAVLKSLGEIQINFSGFANFGADNGSLQVDNVRLERGLGGWLSFGSPNVMATTGSTTLLFASVIGPNNLPLKGSGHIEVEIDDAGSPDRKALYDNGEEEDLRANDAVYSRWLTFSRPGVVKAMLSYCGNTVPEIKDELKVISNPHLAVLTDVKALYDEFIETGTALNEDLDDDLIIDFYQLLLRLKDYAAKYQGMVTDVRRNIDTHAEFSDRYSTFTYGGTDRSTNRFRMAKDIDQLLNYLHRDSLHQIANIVLVGDDAVIPHYRVKDPTERVDTAQGDAPPLQDRRDGYVMTDVPYGTVVSSIQESITTPRPEIPVGRIYNLRPSRLIQAIDSYETPLDLNRLNTSAALFDFYEWPYGEGYPGSMRRVMPALLQRFYPGNDYRLAPPFQPGYTHFGGAFVDWDTESLEALNTARLTIVSTHSSQSSYKTMLTNYGGNAHSLRDRTGTATIFLSCFAGLSIPHYSASNDFSVFEKSLAMTFLGRKNTGYLHSHLATSSRSVDSHVYNAFLTSQFVSNMLSVYKATVGEAFVDSWQGYWSIHSGTVARRSSYSPLLYGLPTQPINHHPPVSASVLRLGNPAALAGPPALRQLIVDIDIPDYKIETNASGDVWAIPANGGTTFAEDDGLPLLPMVTQRFFLPAGAANVQVVEELGARTSQVYGTVKLLLGLSCTTDDGCSKPKAIPGSYPSKNYFTEIIPEPDRVVVSLAAITGSYQPNQQLTLFSHMRFRITYDLPAPAVTLDTIVLNNGQVVPAGQISVPLQLAVTATEAHNLRLVYQISDPAGLLVTSGEAAVTLPGAGSFNLEIILEAAACPPGPKTLQALLVDPEDNRVVDSRILQFVPAGITVDLRFNQPLSTLASPPVVTLEIRDEQGRLVSGLAGRISLLLNGVPYSVPLEEISNGRYQAILPTAGFGSGTYLLVVSATDGRSIPGEAQAYFRFDSSGNGRLYLPLILNN